LYNVGGKLYSVYLGEGDFSSLIPLCESVPTWSPVDSANYIDFITWKPGFTTTDEFYIDDLTIRGTPEPDLPSTPIWMETWFIITIVGIIVAGLLLFFLLRRRQTPQKLKPVTQKQSL
jgi:LPXTG-motif cell wall-anchored protein